MNDIMDAPQTPLLPDETILVLLQKAIDRGDPEGSRAAEQELREMGIDMKGDPTTLMGQVLVVGTRLNHQKTVELTANIEQSVRNTERLAEETREIVQGALRERDAFRLRLDQYPN